MKKQDAKLSHSFLPAHFCSSIALRPKIPLLKFLRATKSHAFPELSPANLLTQQVKLAAYFLLERILGEAWLPHSQTSLVTCGPVMVRPSEEVAVILAAGLR